MSHKITEIAELKKYLSEMIRTGRAGDQYPRIQHALAVTPELVWPDGGLSGHDSCRRRSDRDRHPHQSARAIVHQVNQLWFTVQRRTWAIVYSAAYGRIEFRARTRMGGVSHSVDKTTPGAQVGAVFGAL